MELERIAIGDRFSQLPDEILHHILSCPPLATIDLMLVASLSKRWRYLWKSSPFLNLEDIIYLDNEDDKEAYSRLVDTVLLLRDKMDVHSFRLSLCLDMHPHGQERLYQWAQYAVRRNAKVIELNFHAYKKEVRLPSCLFNCQSVEELAFTFDRLYIYNLPKISPPELVQLGRLKKLHLKHMDLDGDAMDKIFSGCPNLEKLILEECWLISMIFLVNVYTLQDLTMKECVIGGGGLLIACPRLLSFNFVRSLIDVRLVLLWKLVSVVNATVLTDDSPNCEDPDRFHYNAIDFIRGLTSAKTLNIISARLELISEKELSGLPPFDNLENLTLGGWGMSEKFVVVAHFIQNSPNLQMLTLINEEIKRHHHKNEDESSQEHSQENDGAPSQEHIHENEGETGEKLSNGDEAEPSLKRTRGNEGETSHNHSHVNEGETSLKHSHADGVAPIHNLNHEGEPSRKRIGETEVEASRKFKQLWFHCPNSVIQCRVQCGEDNDRLLELVSKVIVSKYTLPDQKVRIIPCDRVQDLDNC